MKLRFTAVIAIAAILVLFANESYARQARNRTPQPATYCFEFGKAIRPHEEHIAKGGEDAASGSPWHLAIADGVGGWCSLGIDAGKYAKGLMERIHQFFVENYKRGRHPDPREAIRESARHVTCPGSTTCCVVTLSPHKPEITSANIGDSGFIIFNPETANVDYRSVTQTRGFNFPVQLAFGQFHVIDEAALAHRRVNVNDIIVVASDGVWDNLFDEDIVYELTHPDPSKPFTAENLAAQIVEAAYHKSISQGYRSPFDHREECERGHKLNRPYRGKQDDISVVIGIVRQGDRCHVPAYPVADPA